MLKKIKNIFEITLVIIGTIIGAGFASGKEIYLFFNINGFLGIAGLFITCITFSLIIYKVFRIIKSINLSSYTEFLKIVNFKNCKIIKIVVLFYLLVSFYIMISGISTYFKQKYNISLCITATIMSFICYVILKKDIKGVILLNNVLVPFIIIFILFLGIKNMDSILNYKIEINDIKTNNFKIFISSILYTSYNSLVLIPILVELKSKISTKKDILLVALIIFIIVLILGTTIFFILEDAGTCLKNIELPMIEVVKKFGKFNCNLYGVVIIIAILTSAISSGYSFIKEIKLINRSFKIELFIMCSIAPFISQIGFSTLIKFLYPIFGILGIIQIYNILLYKIEDKNY